MKRKIDLLFLGILAAVFLALPAGSVINTLSGNTALFYENRSPAPLPDLRFESFWNGTFSTQADAFISDRIPGRDAMIRADTALGMALGRPVSHDVVTAAHQLFPYHGYLTWDVSYTTDKAAAMAQPLAALHKQITGYGGTMVYLGIPQQYSYFRNSYPDYLDNRVWNLDAMTSAFSDALALQGVPFLNMLETYAELGYPAEFYSATDHHYNYRGMLCAYQTLMQDLNARTGADLKIYTEEDLIFEFLSEPFLGSQNRKIYGLWDNDEKLEIAHLKDPISFTRMDNGVEVPPTLYTFPDPGEYATYSVYMGGDVAETIIETDRPDLPSLLVVGDSFTNAMETLLWASFDETRSLDYRYYSGPALSAYIADYQPDIVVILRDDTSYLSDTGNGNLS